MPYSQSAAHDLHNHPNLGVGMHLDLTKGIPFKTIMELVIHSGKRNDPDFPPDTLLTHQSQWEHDFLLSPGFDAWLVMMEAEMVNYLPLSHFTM